MKKNLLQNIGLVCVGTLTAVILGELMLRALGFSYPSIGEYDQIVGARHRANIELDWTTEGRAHVKINKDGWRDREHDLIKLPDVYRIAVLGDSYGEAFQLPMEKTFWFVLEKKLNECRAFGKKQTEMMNFSVSEYATAQAMLTLQTHVWKYSPDLVILAFMTGNDISDNSRTLARNKLRPFFTKSDSGLILDTKFRSDPRFLRLTSPQWKALIRVTDKLRVLQAARLGLYIVNLYRFRAKEQNEKGGEAGLDSEIYRDPPNRDWAEAWEITEALLKTMYEEVKSHGANFLLVTLSNGIQVFPIPSVREAYARSVGAEDLFYPDNRIKSWALREGIDHVILAPLLRAHADQTKTFLHGFHNTRLGEGHWNEEGHQIAGQAIAKYLCETSVKRH